jgi:hypothetical protein
MMQLLSCLRAKTKIGRARVLMVIGVVMYSAAMWVLALWTTRADPTMASLAIAVADAVAILDPATLTGLTVAGTLVFLVGIHLLIDWRAPLPVAGRARPVLETASPPILRATQPKETEVRVTQFAAPPASVEPRQPRSTVYPDGTVFQVAHAGTGKLIWTYAREGSALGFVRDVVRVRSHADAAQFELRIVRRDARAYTLAQGEQLVRRALEDRVL